MKISLRILLINSIIVALVFISSTIAFYSLTRKLLVIQHSKTLLNSANDFIINYQEVVEEINNDFYKISSSFHRKTNIPQNSTDLDFIFRVNSDSLIDTDYLFVDTSVSVIKKNLSLSEFKSLNPNSIINFYCEEKTNCIFYGRILSESLLNNLSKNIRAEIAIMLNNTPLEISNSKTNESLIYNIINASKELSRKNNFDIAKEEIEAADFYATSYSSKTFNLSNTAVNFIIFSKLPEAAELRSGINSALLIIGISGVALSLIFVMLFTEKIRRQITNLSQIAEHTRKGDLSKRVNVITKDEVGRLGLTFNTMLDELERKEANKNEYTEFITLINQNPTLSEIAEAALNKIITSINFTFGQLSLIEENELKIISVYGLNKESAEINKRPDLYQRVIDKAELLEFDFHDDAPTITTGLIKINIRYLLLYPVVYNKTVIAVLELGSTSKPKTGAKEYLDNIHDQLAIGLTNANAFRKLENIVNVLKRLNEEYQKQNDQITDQNKKLLELHKELKEKASELEIQKVKAEDATNLKSQFLASMSHELRTPLNSILGLTELIVNEQDITTSAREKLTIVLRNGNRLMNLINDILDFSKIEAGKMEIITESFKISDLITEVESQITPLTYDKDVNFILHSELNTETIIKTDRKKVTQILLNLLGNAVKFTERGMVILKSKFVDEKLVFEIIDSGIGINEDDIKIIFEEFRQLDGTFTRKYNGTGLGLAISKKFADMLNGDIDCKSEAGKGSVFTLSLPVEIIRNETDKENHTLLNEKKTIVLIDNNGSNRNIIGQYLGAKNYNVVYSSSKEGCFNQIKEKNLFAVVYNISIDKNDSWNFFSEVDELSPARKFPIIIYTIIEDMNIGFGLPVFDYLNYRGIQGKLSQSINRFEKLSGRKIKKISLISDLNENSDAEVIEEIKKECSDREIYFGNEQDINDLKSSKRYPDLFIITSETSYTDGISVVCKIKEQAETKEIPIIFLFPGKLDKEKIEVLNSQFEKAAIRSKGYPIDVLKTIRDRLHLEEGMPLEDTSSIWIDPNIDSDKIPGNGKTNINDKPFTKNVVLIVDDDTDTLFTVGEIVRKTGCETVYAKNGIECLSILSTLNPDLILLDIMMPKMDGFETIKRIRADKNVAGIPIFALTAQAMIEEKEIIIRNGFNDFVPKPVNAANLSFKIKKMLIKNSVETV